MFDEAAHTRHGIQVQKGHLKRQVKTRAQIPKSLIDAYK
jgi:hypothetical protein